MGEKHLQLVRNGHDVKYYILDNECSQDLQRAIESHKLQYQLVPPNQHRVNAAERAIRTFKNHLLAGLATCNPKFPIHEWDRLLDQAELTVNLLRNSRVNPSLSAHAYLHGNHDFNKVPLAPPGTKLVVHSKPDKRASWAYHGEDGWYVGPAPHHYRCFKCYMPTTQKERICDTVQLIPHTIPIPSVTLADHIAIAAENLFATLHHYSTAPPPGIKIGDPIIQGVQKIAKILKTIYPLPQSAPAPQISHPTPSIPLPRVKVPQRVQTPEERLCEYYIKEYENKPQQPVLASVPRVNTNKPHTPSPVPTDNPPSASSPTPPLIIPLPRVKFKTPPPQKHINDINDLIAQYSAIPKATQKHKVLKRAPLQNPKTPPLHIPTKAWKSRLVPHPTTSRLRTQLTKIKRINQNTGTNFKRSAVRQLVAQHVFQTPNMNHVFNSITGKRETMATLLTGEMAETWTKSLANEWGRLAKGIQNQVQGTDTINFIYKNEVPIGQKVTYGNFVCDHRPLKTEIWRTRLTVGGDLLECPYDAVSPAASLIETKLIINSTISDAHKGARFMAADLKDFFLNTPMPHPEFMKIHRNHLPQEIIKAYDLEKRLTADGYIYPHKTRYVWFKTSRKTSL